ncbi:DUF6456 domain-containing protein [Pelagimonas varians]|uniref:DUF6456 domain-containing protein n=1 Tax=Pelagimonas varians TaxID=696760 RepID=A0A238KF63_9RHOB|nr:DUF6456 domain-containing protein [Pelagimonas varians]PYG29955.1 hypothetical protein C8N36_107121 [Pelagimonas varians]SMX40656.1 hypothetical protein PEV8663_02074 [Pelagimonas varians]
MRVPSYLPDPVTAYIEHVGFGKPMRHLARKRDTHASTIKRQIDRITKIEASSALVAAALQEADLDWALWVENLPSADEWNSTCQLILMALGKPGTLLAWSSGLDTAAVMKSQSGTELTVLARCASRIAALLQMAGWIVPTDAKAKVYCLKLSPAGRAHLIAHTAEIENQQTPQLKDARHGPQEYDPLETLWQRRHRQGQFKIDPELQKVGLWIRQDAIQTRAKSLKAVLGQVGRANASDAMAAARLASVIQDLGPGVMPEVVWAYCVTKEPIEELEARLGLPNRSAKALFREALRRVQKIYLFAFSEECIQEQTLADRKGQDEVLKMLKVRASQRQCIE